jgi:hypothetical protein
MWNGKIINLDVQQVVEAQRALAEYELQLSKEMHVDGWTKHRAT